MNNFLLEKVKNKLNELGVKYDSVAISDKPGKKIKIIISGLPIHFGAKGSLTFLEFPDKKKREAYIARHSKIFLKDGSKAIDKIYSPAWFSMNVLW